MSWYPLGQGDKSLINEPVFAELGKKYGKSPAQIILRWHGISANTLKDMDRAIENFKMGDVSPAIDLSDF